VDESRPGKHLVGNVDPRNRIPGQRTARCGLWRYVRRGVAIERDFLGELPIAGSDVAGSQNGAVLDVERVDINAQPFRRVLKKDKANLGAGMTKRTARLLNGEAARRDALVGAQGRRRPDHLHPRQIDVEFVGDDLRQRCHDALPDLHLARRDSHLSRA
jgi:hypothetical protein